MLCRCDDANLVPIKKTFLILDLDKQNNWQIARKTPSSLNKKCPSRNARHNPLVYDDGLAVNHVTIHQSNGFILDSVVKLPIKWVYTTWHQQIFTYYEYCRLIVYYKNSKLSLIQEYYKIIPSVSLAVVSVISLYFIDQSTGFMLTMLLLKMYLINNKTKIVFGIHNASIVRINMDNKSWYNLLFCIYNILLFQHLVGFEIVQNLLLVKLFSTQFKFKILLRKNCYNWHQRFNFMVLIGVTSPKKHWLCLQTTELLQTSYPLRS